MNLQCKGNNSNKLKRLSADFVIVFKLSEARSNFTLLSKRPELWSSQGHSLMDTHTFIQIYTQIQRQINTYGHRYAIKLTKNYAHLNAYTNTYIYTRSCIQWPRQRCVNTHKYTYRHKHKYIYTNSSHKNTGTHTHTHTYIYIYMCACVCVCARA